MNDPTDATATRPIVVAVDFSDDSRAALRWAARYAAATRYQLLVLHVVHDPAAEPGYYWEQSGRYMQPMHEVAARMLEQFIDELECDDAARDSLRSAERRLLRGLPPGRIVELADLLRAELIVIGSRGMTGLPHILQGSVSERVVELASCPVVVVKARGKRQRDEEKAQRKAEKARRKQEKKARKAMQSDRHADDERTERDGRDD